MTCEQAARDLDAYVDGELETDLAAALRDHLTGCATCHRQLAERQAVGRLVRGAPYFSAPDRLRERVLEQTARSTSRRHIAVWAAAAVLAISVGGGLTLLRSSSRRADAVVEQVVDGHVRSLMANHLFDVQSTDQHTVKPWFLGKLDFAPPVIDLASRGFPLVGGRLDYLAGQPVAALVYQRQKHTINVFVSPDRDATAASPSVRSARGFHVHRWLRDGMAFWAVSDLNDVELTQFVDALGAP
jgi:anti-sigma factor (TIGR02949 family)